MGTNVCQTLNFEPCFGSVREQCMFFCSGKIMIDIHFVDMKVTINRTLNFNVDVYINSTHLFSFGLAAVHLLTFDRSAIFTFVIVVIT